MKTIHFNLPLSAEFIDRVPGAEPHLISVSNDY